VAGRIIGSHVQLSVAVLSVPSLVGHFRVDRGRGFAVSLVVVDVLEGPIRLPSLGIPLSLCSHVRRAELILGSHQLHPLIFSGSEDPEAYRGDADDGGESDEPP